MFEEQVSEIWPSINLTDISFSNSVLLCSFLRSNLVLYGMCRDVDPKVLDKLIVYWTTV